MCTFMYTTPTFRMEALRLVTQSSTAVFNNCYSDIVAYTALAYSYWASLHDALQF